jgi:transposase-like protein
MPSWMALSIGAMIVVVAFVIVRSVRKVMFDVDRQMKPVHKSRQGFAAREMIEQLRKLDVRCPRCGEEAFLLIGTKNGYKCDSCRHQFTGAPHPKMS